MTDTAPGFYRGPDGRLCVDGQDVGTLADTYGTPLYLYSGAGLVARFNAFAQAVAPVQGRVHFAVKANSNLSVLSLLAQAGAGADIVSGGEMARALAAGIAPEHIVFSGVGKTDEEIADALRQHIGQINAESAAEIERISHVASQMGVIAPVALRVNVNVDAGTHEKISTGQRSTKFGISVADGEAARLYQRLADDAWIEPSGLAVHIGSQITNLAPFEAAYQALLTLADALRDQGLPVPMLDLGGGLGIDYEASSGSDFDGYGAMVTRIFGNRGYQLGFEPGRSIAADNGLFVTRTLYVKDGADKRFVIVDGAMNDLIRPTLYEAYHRIEPVETDAGQSVGLADIVGPVCETGDYLGRGRKMAEVNRGDLLAVFSAGAYGAVMMSNYNTRPEAAEVLIHDGAAHLVRPRRRVADLLEGEINPFAPAP